ncbi:uncharacterized protein LOC108490752, partial [Nannospalax galili]|uniref:uncharacterized protein LOC108490752 n=1 Tax=Nannospalax galili TaxID=1026970 RepID=UPI000819F083
MGCQPILSDLAGPLPDGTVGLVIGRSSASLKGLTVHPGVVDQDYTGTIQILCSSPRGISAISPGDRVAQLLILPSCHQDFPSTGVTRGEKGFGSSGGQHAYLSLGLQDRPMLALSIEGKRFQGLLDTGADTSIISAHWWPSKWPLTRSSQPLTGLGYEDTPSLSARPLHWETDEGQRGTLIPFSANDEGHGMRPRTWIRKKSAGTYQPCHPEGKARSKRGGFFIGATEEAIPINWKTEEPVWVPQWPLPSDKLKAAEQLVQEQLTLGHLECSQSPWNTPIFVIKKKSGKWRLLHDLRAINNQMQIMGPIQRGLPLLSALPSHWHIIIIDIKDCFFSIPLAIQDRERFAFTLPSINHEEPDKRFQWKVLPQGMANSPTMCQLYVAAAIQPVRDKHKSLRICHYMDDILLCHANLDSLHQAFADLSVHLQAKGLLIAPEKVQEGEVANFLGSTIFPNHIKPQKLTIRKDNLKTLNDFQKLLGDINWIRSYLNLPVADLKPLFKILEGEPAITSSRHLTKEAARALAKVEDRLQEATLSRLKPSKPFQLCVLPSPQQPTAVLWQSGPLLWIHPQSSPGKVLSYYPEQVANLALKGLQSAVTYFGHMPNCILVPYTAQQVDVLSSTIDSWAILRCIFPGEIDNHYPKHPLLTFSSTHSFIFPKITRRQPILGAIDVYTDGSKTGIGSYVINSRPVQVRFSYSSPQLVECAMVSHVLEKFSQPLNIISDSHYVVRAVQLLETVGVISTKSSVSSIFINLQQIIRHRTAPFFIQHIRAHSLLPGPMAKANDLADQATKAICLALAPEKAAAAFHDLYHVPAQTLRLRFGISRAAAREIVQKCANCADFRSPPYPGVNPRGLLPLHVWQMDVTHISSLGKLQFVHVSIDTCSGVIHATPLAGEKALHVITHCLEAWAAWGKPRQLKTDNGPAYTSKSFQQFCHRMGVHHVTGLPYNPQGQGIVERANGTLKAYLQKQKGGICPAGGQKANISLATFTLNFLNLDAHGRSAADRHANHVPIYEKVKWKDVLDNQWKGPDPVLMRSRGAVCVFPQ